VSFDEDPLDIPRRGSWHDGAMLRSVIATFLLLAACDRHAPAPAPPSPMRSPSQPAAARPELSPALARLAWWLGDRD
jgi:hypothetical protein